MREPEGSCSILREFNLTLFEVNEAAEIIAQAADPEANIIFGAVVDETLEDEVRVTVIATGFEDDKFSSRPVRRIDESKSSLGNLI